jgi:hypothetical protein
MVLVIKCRVCPTGRTDTVINNKATYVCSKSHLVIERNEHKLFLNLGELDERQIVPLDAGTQYLRGETITGDQLEKIWGFYSDVETYWYEA